MQGIGQLFDAVLLALSTLIVVRTLLSWFIQDPDHPVMKILIELTEPVIRPIRRLMPQTMGFDFSPLAAIFAIFILRQILASLLR